MSMEQKVTTLKLKDLVLWTENPRDPIDEKAKDQTIVDRALGEQTPKWNLTKLAGEMGKRYDFSELPTVVYHGNKPIVYDGNRRVILGKIKHGLVNAPDFDTASLPAFPSEIPCNVCTEAIALDHVLRKHGDSGSWEPLERDIFLHNFMHERKSAFLLLEENTGIITANPHLNKVFVKEEIFKEDSLKDMGFEFINDKLYSVYEASQAIKILTDLTQKILDKKISTRHNRGKVLDVLDPKSRKLIDDNKENSKRVLKVTFKAPTPPKDKKGKQKLTKTTKKTNDEIFGGKLYLNAGNVNNLYRDIARLYEFYLEKEEELSSLFPSLIRMALRLLCETASKETNHSSIDKYIKAHFENAKKGLSKDIKTALSGQNVSEDSLTQLLQTGAHNYPSSNNLAQTIAISIILGSMLKLTHGNAS